MNCSCGLSARLAQRNMPSAITQNWFFRALLVKWHRLDALRRE
jgi:hypothetical protein